GPPHHTVGNAKAIYNDILEYFETRQDKLFVVITAPPMQDPKYPANARAFNTWLVEEWLAANLNLGGAENLETFYGEYENRRSLVRRDLSSLPTDISVVSATLELYRYEGEAEDAMPVALYRVTREWTEGTGFDVEPNPTYIPDGATWQNASPGVPWDAPGGDYDTSTDYGHGPNGIISQTTLPVEQGNGRIRLDATAAVRAWIEEGVPNYGVLLRPLSGEYTYHYYCSRQYETSNLRPRLIVTYAVDGATTSTPTSPVQPSVTPTFADTPIVEPWLHLPIILKSYTPISAQLIQPTDLEYLGAFRLPEGPEEIGWEYSGAAMTYYPDGDLSGPMDGYPGSIFGTGHNWNQYVSEINIPIPVIAPSKDVNQLNTARTLQGFHYIRGDLFGDFEIPRVGLEYLPKQDGQATDKLHFCWGQHMQEGESGATHGWCELDLSNPQTRGAWCIGDQVNYVTNDYIFAIPQAWSDANTPGLLLATGRFRDGGQGGRGPALFAYGPWNEGNPPAPGSRLQTIPLLLYSSVDSAENLTLNGYHHSDEWSGGAWLTAQDKSAVIFVGTKGLGECWYGFADGTVWPDEPPYPPIPDPPNDSRGWWSDSFVGQMLFYDPADLASIARGDLDPHEPQPYATLGIDQFLFSVQSSRQKHHVGAAGFDRERGHLYIFEPLADGDKSLVHVWRVQ
ncbi:MAG: DNRLRE domain-containing protein, partial [Anaerolineae bacterium]|nr:DNRLRE domain-containing protein [Anaerolineae bacterium]